MPRKGNSRGPKTHRKGNQKNSINFWVYLFLLAITLTSNTYFGKRMAATTAVSLSLKKTETENQTEYKNEIDDDNTSVFYFYNTTWPPLRKVLCGEGAPNIMLSQKLFKLARFEVFNKDSHRNHNPRAAVRRNSSSNSFAPTRPIDLSKRLSENVSSNTLAQFFSGDFGASVFQGVNEKGEDFVSLYVRILKCGNNQIRWMERNLFKHYNGTYIYTLPLWKALDNVVPMPPPCIYTVVRDPISHFLSGYNEIEVRLLGDYDNKIFHGKSLPYHLDVPYSSESPELRKRRFQAFVEDLLLEDPVFGSLRVYSHIFSMSRVLVVLAKYNKKLSGYIPKLENVTSAWPEFISSTYLGFPSREYIPKMTKQGQHESSQDRLGLYRAAKDVWEEFGPISRSLCLLHAFDYACYEDLPDGIPELCRSVYRDHSEEIVRKYENKKQKRNRRNREQGKTR